MDLSIIIPCKNEDDKIENNLKKVYSFFRKNKKISRFEIIVIDDGSTDDTYEIIKKLKSLNIRLNKKRINLGKGYSVREGVMMSKYDWILFFDADLSTPLEELNKFFLLENYDIMIGSRRLRKSNAKRNLLRKLSGEVFANLSNKILGISFSDPQCGVKMFKSSIAKKIFSIQKINRWAFDSEILFLAKKMNFEVKEIPIKWSESGKSNINLFKDAFKMTWDLFKIRFGRYPNCM